VVPTTLAAWEEVEAKLKSGGSVVMSTAGAGAVGSSAVSRSTLNQPRLTDDNDEFVSLSQQLHKNLAPPTAAAATTDGSSNDGESFSQSVGLQFSAGCGISSRAVEFALFCRILIF